MSLQDDVIMAIKADGGKWLLRAYLPQEEREAAYQFDSMFEPPKTADDRVAAVLRNIESAVSKLITPNSRDEVYTGLDVAYAIKLTEAVIARREAMRDKGRLDHFDESLRNGIERYGFDEATKQLIYDMDL